MNLVAWSISVLPWLLLLPLLAIVLSTQRHPKSVDPHPGARHLGELV